jgi:hypothetical protein
MSTLNIDLFVWGDTYGCQKMVLQQGKIELSFHKYPTWWVPMEGALDTRVIIYPPCNIEVRYCEVHNVLVVYMRI